MQKREKALETARKLKQAGIELDDIIEMLEELEDNRIDDDVMLVEIMKEAGITANYLGYKYLTEAIKLNYNSFECIQLHNKVYPAVAEKFGVKPSNVEKAIRHVIEVTWKKNPEFCKKVLGEKALSAEKKPANGAFIAAIAQYYYMKVEHEL